MFLYYFVTVPGSFVEVGRTLTDALGGEADHADLAYRHGEELRARLQPDTVRLAKTVRLTVGRPVTGEREITLPVLWEATGPTGLFPKMEADIIVSNMAPNLTQVIFRGSYRPPLGPLGRTLDRVALHRLAEATVKNFLDRLAAAIIEAMPRETVPAEG